MQYLLLLPALASILSILVCGVAICFGLDLTDEGFALNYLNNHSQFKGLFTYYGLIYGPIFSAFNSNIIWLRAFNLVSVLSMSVLLIFFSCPTSDFRPASSPPSTQRFKHHFRFLFSLVFGSLGLLSLWPFLTPTYGHVCFLAILMYAISICIYTTGPLSRNFLPRGFSSCLCFLAGTYLLLSAKIPAAVVFLPFILLFSLLSSFRFFLCFLVSGVAGIILWFVHLVSSLGGLQYAIDDIALSFEILSFYESTYGFSALLAKLAPGRLPSLLLALSVFVVSSFLFFPSLCKRFSLLRFRPLTAFISFVFLGLFAFLFSRFSFLPYFFALVSENLSLLIFAIFVASFLILLIRAVAKSFRLGLSLRSASCVRDLFIHHRPLALRGQYLRNSLCLFCFPFLYALTSGNSFYDYASHSVVFVAASLLFLARYLSTYLSFNALLSCYFISPFLLLVSVFGLYFAHPFLQPSLIGTDISQVDFIGSSIWVDSRRASSLSLLKSDSVDAGFKRGDPVLDLSAMYPGLTSYLDGVPLGWPWILGYAEGSTEVGLKILEGISKTELDDAWLILPSHGASSNLDYQRLLSSLGLDIPSASSRPAFEFQCLDQSESADCSALFYRLSSLQHSQN